LVYSTSYTGTKTQSSASQVSTSKSTPAPPTSTTSESTLISSTSTNSSQSVADVQLQISEWAMAIDNVSLAGPANLSSLYTDSSVMTLNSNSTVANECWPLAEEGVYTGVANITNVFVLSYVDSGVRPSPTLVTISNLTLKDVGGDVNATFRYFLNGTSAVYGEIQETVNVQQLWTTQETNQWHIEQDYWIFQAANVQNPIC
jgi:hypothetical protein